jgi:hypothetical protein
LSVKDYIGNIQLWDGTTQLGTTIAAMTLGSQYNYANFTGLNLTVLKGQTKAIDIKVNVIRATTTTGNSGVCFYFGVATTTGANIDVAGTGLQSGSSATIASATGGVAGNCMLLSSSGSLIVQVDANSPVQSTMIDGAANQTFGKWKFTANNEAVKISKLVFDTTHSASATGTSLSGTGAQAGLWVLATSVAGFPNAFNYSLNNAATQTCMFAWGGANGATGTDKFIATMNSASSTCWASSSAGIMALSGANATTGGTVTLYASPAGNYSLAVTDYPNPKDAVSTNASNTADNLQLGVKYGGTETIGAYAGSDSNVVKMSLWDDVLGTKLIDGFLVSGSTTFSFVPGQEIVIPANGNKVLSLKADLSDNSSAVEGSTMQFGLGTAASAYQTNYIVAQGVSSGTTLAESAIVNSSAATTTALTANSMYVYATKPSVSLNASSPSGAQAVGTSKEVFRFDITAPATGFDINVNAVRFTIGTNASSAAFDKTYNLYKSTDLSTAIGTGISWASATSSGTSGFVTIYPFAGNAVGSGSTVTYTLYANTSAMNESSIKTETLSLSIENNDLFWNDTLAANANQKVLNLPVRSNALTY